MGIATFSLERIPKDTAKNRYKKAGPCIGPRFSIGYFVITLPFPDA